MELKDFLRLYRKQRKYSVRKLAETIDVSNFRMEKWEKGVIPNYEDGIKIKRYFGIRDFQNISEDLLKTFEPSNKESEAEYLLRMKDLLIEEKDKRIETLEETINILKEAMAEYQTKKKG
jgi:DNA-binding XRE family transcriptional regulator